MTMNEINDYFLGIDLGTTNSLVAVYDKSGIVQVLANMEGDLMTHSAVSLADLKPTVGKIARQDRFLYPDKVIEQFKKLMATVTDTGEPVPLIIGEDGTEYTAITLSAEVLRYLEALTQPI